MNNFLISLLAVFLSFSSLGQPAEIDTAISPLKTFPVAAEKPGLPNGPVKKQNLSRGVDTSAESVLAIDSVSQKILFSKNPDRILPVASLTKLMSALVLNDLIQDWQSEITFTSQDRKGGNKPNLFPGDKINREQMLNVALIGSDNDAIAALVRSSGLPQEEFVKKMNEKAVILGMDKTIFSDTTGLNPENKSTVSDLSKLVKVAFNSERIRKAVSLEKYQIRTKNKSRQVHNTNQLLSSFLNAPPYQIIGGKTGFIEEAGYNLAVEIKNQGATVIAIVLGSKSNKDRFQEVKSLIAWAFENYQWPGVSVAGTGL